MSVTEQSKYEMFDTQKQINKWKAREEMLMDWIEHNTPLHPDFTENYHQLMHAKRKLQQLRQRHYRKYKKNNGLEEVYIPNI